ncbi:MAG TPA: ABC transporter permease [Terriglobales bacterium]|jgi:predicted permease|nr:ABC transporter permease [Terriglobales bacterium]
METLLQDIRYGLRMLRKSPGFTAVAVITLALGIGATTAIFSVVYGVLLRPLAYDHPQQIVELHEVNAHGGQMHFADPNFEDVQAQAHSLQGMAEYGAWEQSVSGGSEPTRTIVAAVSRDFFSVLRIQPFLGRGFLPQEQRFGATPVALVSYGYWQQFLGGTPDFASKKLVIDNRPATIIGVLPPQFSFPSAAEILQPRELYRRLPSRTAHNWGVIGRLADGASLPQARAELQAIATRLKRQYGENTMMVSVAIAPLREVITSQVRPALWILLGAVGFLLLIACANVANLLLVQSAARKREIAVRCALGATRSRIIRQSLVEALLLALAGTALGVLGAYWGLQALLALAPGVLPRLREVSISTPVLLFCVATAALVAAGLGIFSGLRSSAGDVQNALAAGGRSQSGGLVSQRLSRGIVAGQLAITLALLAGAALLGRSLLRVLSVNPGFRTQHIITMNLVLPPVFDWTASDLFANKDAASARRVEFLDQLFSRLRAIPGVQDVGGTGDLPLTEQASDGTYALMNPGEAPPRSMQEMEQLYHDRSRTGDADYSPATGGFFRVLNIPLLRGRLFNQADTVGSPHVAIISQSLVREKWPNQDPLGHRIEFGNMDGDLRLLTVVGVVGDVRQASLERPPRPTIYVDCRQRAEGTSDFTVVLRTYADSQATISAARRIMRELDPTVPPQFSTLSEVVSGSLQSRRFNLTLVSIFAATALLLALAGMYGVMAYSVARRTSEIGVRMALGASQASVLRMVLRQGLLTAAAGVLAGIVISLAVTRSLGSLLFGLGPTDPLTFAGTALLLVIVAILASYVPARRAAKVDPMVALRYE